MSNLITPYRSQVRQHLANITGKPLDDYNAESSSDKSDTLPEKMKNRGAGNIGGEYRPAMNLGLSFLSSLQARNPITIADAASRMMYSKFLESQKKTAEIYLRSMDTSKTASARHDQAIELLNNPECMVSVVLLCLRELFGDEFYGFEPESIFFDLQDEGVRVNDQLMEKINCGLCLALQPDFLNDALTFENCVRVMCGLDIVWHRTQKPDIAYICWGVTEALMIMGLEHPDMDNDAEFSDEVEMYVAIALHHDNYMLAPPELEFAQELLDDLNTNVDLIMPELKQRWSTFQKNIVEGTQPELNEDDLVDVQLQKLGGCWYFCQEQHFILEGLREELK